MNEVHELEAKVMTSLETASAFLFETAKRNPPPAPLTPAVSAYVDSFEVTFDAILVEVKALEDWGVTSKEATDAMRRAVGILRNTAKTIHKCRD